MWLVVALKIPQAFQCGTLKEESVCDTSGGHLQNISLVYLKMNKITSLQYYQIFNSYLMVVAYKSLKRLTMTRCLNESWEVNTNLCCFYFENRVN